MKSELQKWLNIASFIIVIVMNSLVATTNLIGGKTTAQVSDAYPTLVTPAGYVFSIWSVIYVLLGVFVIAQTLPRDGARVFREKIGWLFILSCVLNVVWLFLWQFELLPASVIIMFLLLATIASIYTRLGIADLLPALKGRGFLLVRGVWGYVSLLWGFSLGSGLRPVTPTPSSRDSGLWVLQQS